MLSSFLENLFEVYKRKGNKVTRLEIYHYLADHAILAKICSPWGDPFQLEEQWGARGINSLLLNEDAHNGRKDHWPFMVPSHSHQPL